MDPGLAIEDMYTDNDHIVDQLFQQYDQTTMPIPDIEFAPQLLISKVRKHYMEYLIKLLSVNYETHQKLNNKNIYLPSAIWRCAKNIEMAAAQACMVAEIYRKSIIPVIKELKSDTKKSKLNRKLYECLHRAPENEKNFQTTLKMGECNCVCTCNSKKKRRKMSNDSKNTEKPNTSFVIPQCSENDRNAKQYPNKIPVLINSQVDQENETAKLENTTSILNAPCNSLQPEVKMSVESQESDELMAQLEKLFQADPNDDDIFDSTLCDNLELYTMNDNVKKAQIDNSSSKCSDTESNNTSAMNQNTQTKSLDERLASLTGLLTNSTDVVQSNQDPPKTKKTTSSKWLCEEYYLKTQLFDLLDQIGDYNRKRLGRIKEMLLKLFGEDSDDEDVASPLEETPEFIVSCKERVAPWVVKLLTPYYIRGRIRGKALFKALAKHLIRLIYQCSHYPREEEVTSFVTDFLENHNMIRCEADFKQFRIENI